MINILPYNQKKTVKKFRNLRIFTTIVWGLTIIVIVAATLVVPTLMTINFRYKIANNQVKLLEESGAVVKTVDVANLEGRIANASTKLAAKVTSTPIVYINEIKKITPKGINIHSFNVSDFNVAKVDVQGIASTRDSLQEFVSILGKNETIESVDSPVSNFVKSTNANFVITIVFKK